MLCVGISKLGDPRYVKQEICKAPNSEQDPGADGEQVKILPPQFPVSKAAHFPL